VILAQDSLESSSVHNRPSCAVLPCTQCSACESTGRWRRSAAQGLQRLRRHGRCSWWASFRPV